MSLQTPVAFFIFNRPDLTATVFAAIARAQPRHLLVVADGPRHETEAALCHATRAVVERVDWPCQVETLFSEVNLGCETRLSSGLDWVFSRVEAAIVLEDDCLPCASFFPFCEAMLARFRDDERIMHISGDSFVPLSDAAASYGFSRYIHVWGWATWRRAWQHYDVSVAKSLPAQQQILRSFSQRREARFWNHMFDAVQRGKIETWDIQWFLTCWLRGGLAVVPRANLVSNLGFRADATHVPTSLLAGLPTFDFSIENHPPEVRADADADRRERRRLIYDQQPTLGERVLRKIAKIAKSRAKKSVNWLKPS